MTTPSPAELAERRAAVARLSHDGASLREIGEQLGISKDTAGRDLKAWERDSMRQPDQQDETPTTAAETAGATAETPDATAPETPATATLEPAAGHWLSLPLPVDDEFLEDLAVLTRCGRSDAEAIGRAVHEIANAYRGAWAAGAYPRTAEPRIHAFELAPYRPPLREDRPMTDDLVAFLRARLDEEAALAGSGETWTASDEAPNTGTRRVDVDHSFERVTACTRSWRALHIARHDPARVLAEVEAKRQLVDLHGPVILRGGSGAQHFETTKVCRSCEPPRQFPEHAFPCPTLRLFALPYADHLDYRDEWRPQG